MTSWSTSSVAVTTELGSSSRHGDNTEHNNQEQLHFGVCIVWRSRIEYVHLEPATVIYTGQPQTPHRLGSCYSRSCCFSENLFWFLIGCVILSRRDNETGAGQRGIFGGDGQLGNLSSHQQRERLGLGQSYSCNHSCLLIKMGAGQYWKGPKLNFIGSTVVAGPKQAQGQWMAIKVVLNFIDTAI